MSVTIENILLVGSILLFISVLAGKTSYKFGVPTLIFFLLIGMLAGSEGIGGIHFNDPQVAQFIGIAALNFILFSGGFDTDWKTTRPIAWQGIALSTLGVLITAGLVGIFVWYFTDFTIYEGLLLGSIVSSTDAAAVFSILRSKNISLKYNLRPTLELESGSNDPMAYFLTIACTMLVMFPEMKPVEIIPMFLKQILIGGAVGFFSGKICKYIINNIKLEYEALYPVLVISMMFLIFSITDYIGGNGFLAVYLSAVYLGNQHLIHKRTIIKVFDGFAWLMQIVLFLTLGLLVFPSQIVQVIGIGLLVSAFLIIVARPVSVMLSLIFFKIKLKSKLFISWVGLRGAVPIVFATYPLIAGVEKSPMIFNIVFFISLTSVMIQGTFLPKVARLLRVTAPANVKKRMMSDFELDDAAKATYSEIDLSENYPAKGKRILELGFPKTAVIAMVRRHGKFISPNGSTVLEPGDKLLVFAENEKALDGVYKALGIQRDMQV